MAKNMSFLCANLGVSESGLRSGRAVWELEYDIEEDKKDQHLHTENSCEIPEWNWETKTNQNICSSLSASCCVLADELKKISEPKKLVNDFLALDTFKYPICERWNLENTCKQSKLFSLVLMSTTASGITGMCPNQHHSNNSWGKKMGKHWDPQIKLGICGCHWLAKTSQSRRWVLSHL